MNISSIIERIQGQAIEAKPRFQVGLSPDVLLREGILSDPEKPEQAFRRAKRLVQQGHYKEARDLLFPHARTESPSLRLEITELLANCAMHGSGGDWEELLKATLKGFLDAKDDMGVARTRRDLGEMLVAVGRIDEAEDYLKAAADLFVRLGDRARAAKVECLRARARLRAGYVNRALDRINHAVDTFIELGHGRGLALARLERACILARHGDNIGAARDLLAAERFLASSGGAFDRLRARLARAECLHILGESQRAVAGLKRALVDVVDLEETPIRAHVHTLLGQACMELNPSAARQYLMRGRHLYESLKLDYYVTLCDIELARVEHKIGFDARGRLKQVSERPVTEWPAIASTLALARAEVSGTKEPERARLALFRARSFAQEAGDRSLKGVVDRVLLATGLATEEEVTALTDTDPNPVLPLVEVGDGGEPGKVRSAPEPFFISDVSSDHGVIIQTRPEHAARIIRRDAPQHAGITLKEPQAVGVRRPA